MIQHAVNQPVEGVASRFLPVLIVLPLGYRLGMKTWASDLLLDDHSAYRNRSVEFQPTCGSDTQAMRNVPSEGISPHAKWIMV